MGLRFGGLGLGAICVPCGPKTYPVAIGAFLPWLSRGSHTRPKTRRSPDQRTLPTPIFVLTLAVLSLSTSLGVNGLVVRAAPGAQCFDFEPFDSSVLPLFYCRLQQSSGLEERGKAETSISTRRVLTLPSGSWVCSLKEHDPKNLPWNPKEYSLLVRQAPNFILLPEPLELESSEAELLKPEEAPF